MSTPNTRAPARITQIALNDHRLAALDDRGRIWIAIALGCNPPEWRLLPLPEEPSDTAAPVQTGRTPCPTCNGTGNVLVEADDELEADTCPECGGDGHVLTEAAGLRQELASLLYHAGRDLHYLAADIEAAVGRLAGEGKTAEALAAAALVRTASDACDKARQAVAEEVAK